VFIRRLSCALLLLLGCPAAAPILAGGHETLGPLRVGERNPLFRRFYMPRAEPAAPAAAGTWTVELGGDYANVFERAGDGVFFQEFDMEALLGDLTLRRGLPGGWEAGADLQIHHYERGFLDPWIQDFHDAFGLANDTRDEVDDGGYRFLLERLGEAALLDTPRQKAAFADPILFAKRALGSRWSAKAAVKLPLGEDAISTNKIDAALEALYHRDWGRWRGHFQLAAITVNAPDVLADIARDAALFGMAAVERALGPRWAAIAQVDANTPLFADTGLETLDEPPVNLTLGLAGAWGRHWRWQAAFAEDLIAKGPSVDIAFHFRLARTF